MCIRRARPCPADVADSATGRPAGRQEPGSVPDVPVPVAVLNAGWRGRWTGQGVSLYRATQTTISVVATIWIAPSTMNTPAPMATARAVIRTDDSSHTPKAIRLMPAEQRALMRWGNLRHIRRSGQPRADKTPDLCRRHHHRLTAHGW